MQKRVQRVAQYLMLAFIAGSAIFHFTAGSTIVTLFPSWRYQPMPEQAVSIISLSQMMRQQHIPPPTPPPPPPPKITKRTAQHLALLKYREIGSHDAVIGTIRPPARRKSNIVVAGPAQPKPGAKEAPVVTNEMPPTPAARPGGARTDTGGKQDELNGNIVWGDDNPPRVVRLAPIATSNAPAQPVRILVEVGPDGNVLSVKLLQSSGDANLDELVMEGVRKATFAPATLNGLPVHGTMELEYPPSTTRST
jgi:TonB family protein